RFVSLPTTLEWYMKHVFGLERSLMKAVRPIANRLGPVKLPPESYFQNVQDLFDKIAGVDTALEDSSVTSVRLITNAEKMVLRETQRAFVYFSLHGLTVDHIIVNRVLPDEVQDGFFRSIREEQNATLAAIEQYFAPVPVRRVPMFPNEMLGFDRLRQLASKLYAEGEDPAAVTRVTRPFTFARDGDHYEVRLELPFAEKGEIGLFKKQDELVVEVGTIRRQVGLPTTMANLQPVKAKLEGRMLKVEMREEA
ncbi:MAG: ArsA family ATPase, partial [Bryobacteraceae bacterium]